MQLFIYQDIKDDLGRFSSSRMDAQAGNTKIETCMETKLLDLHPDISYFIKESTTELRNDLMLNPLKLYGKNMTKKKFEQYLGDLMVESAEATVNNRHGKMIHSIKKIRAIVEDCLSNTLGGLKVGMDIRETAYVPSLLSSTWMEIKATTKNKL